MSGDAMNVLADALARAKAAGADAADAVLVRAVSTSHRRRLGKTELLERSEGHDMGLRVLVGKRQAVVSTNDWTPARLAEIAERAVAMARAVPEDAEIGLADPGQLFSGPLPELDSVDAVEPDAETLIARAAAAEDAALGVQGVTNSEGAEASWGGWEVALMASNGFSGSYSNTRHSVSVYVIAGEGTGMEGGYDGWSAAHASDLRSPDELGRAAGERAIGRLGPRKVKTGRMPVVFDRRISGGMIGNIAAAINGAAIARGASFLKSKLGQQILPANLTIWDDPLRVRGLKSRPFDAEGLATTPRAIVENGVLTSWILDLRTARKLGMQSTGHAGRGASGPPSPGASNLYLPAGNLSVAELIGDIEEGVLVTSAFGSGANLITGDYSRGAAGFKIEKGQITYPINEFTIAGNLTEMLACMVPADDLEFRSGTDAPTIRIDSLTVAGN